MCRITSVINMICCIKTYSISETLELHSEEWYLDSRSLCFLFCWLLIYVPDPCLSPESQTHVLHSLLDTTLNLSKRKLVFSFIYPLKSRYKLLPLFIPLFIACQPISSADILLLILFVQCCCFGLGPCHLLLWIFYQPPNWFNCPVPDLCDHSSPYC